MCDLYHPPLPRVWPVKPYTNLRQSRHCNFQGACNQKRSCKGCPEAVRHQRRRMLLQKREAACLNLAQSFQQRRLVFEHSRNYGRAANSCS